MSEVSAITAVSAISANDKTSQSTAAQKAETVSFEAILRDGMASLQSDIQKATDAVQRFALSSDMPIHDVMIAMEKARFSVELTLEVRNRLVEGYREIMNMQI